jgi:hypothetical protein
MIFLGVEQQYRVERTNVMHTLFYDFISLPIKTPGLWPVHQTSASGQISHRFSLRSLPAAIRFVSRSRISSIQITVSRHGAITRIHARPYSIRVWNRLPLHPEMVHIVLLSLTNLRQDARPQERLLYRRNRCLWQIERRMVIAMADNERRSFRMFPRVGAPFSGRTRVEIRSDKQHGFLERDCFQWRDGVRPAGAVDAEIPEGGVADVVCVEG